MFLLLIAPLSEFAVHSVLQAACGARDDDDVADIGKRSTSRIAQDEYRKEIFRGGVPGDRAPLVGSLHE